MKVSELKQLLENEPDDNEVMLYHYHAEEAGMLSRVRRERKDDEEGHSYCKGDHPYDYGDATTDEITVLEAH